MKIQMESYENRQKKAKEKKVKSKKMKKLQQRQPRSHRNTTYVNIQMTKLILVEIEKKEKR